MKTRHLIYIFLFCTVTVHAQQGSITITDNRGQQYLLFDYSITPERLLITGVSDNGATKVNYIDRKLSKRERSVFREVSKKFTARDFNSEYFSDYSNFKYISSDNYPRCIEIIFREKDEYKKIRIVNSFVAKAAALINELNPLFPAEVRINYMESEFPRSF